MNGETEQKIPKGSYAAGRRVRLPKGASEPIVVYINGIAQTAGTDYDIQGNNIVFARQIIKEIIGKTQWLVMFIGVIGSYRKNETVDVQYTLNGQTQLASDLKIIPDSE